MPYASIVTLLLIIASISITLIAVSSAFGLFSLNYQNYFYQFYAFYHYRTGCTLVIINHSPGTYTIYYPFSTTIISAPGTYTIYLSHSYCLACIRILSKGELLTAFQC